MSLQIKFYCRLSKITKDGTAPIEMSICYFSERVIASLPRKCNPKTFKKDKSVKAYLAVVEQKVWDTVTEMTKRSIPVNTRSIIDVFQNGFPQEKVYTVGDLFADYWQLLSAKDKAGQFTLNNWGKYERARNCFLEFVGRDKALVDIKSADIEKWKMFLVGKGYKGSTVGQYLCKVKTVMLYALNNGKIKVNPFYGIKIEKASEKIEIMTDKEYISIRDKRFDIKRIDKIRDLFIFACNCGLSYVDVVNLSSDDIKLIDGRYIINKCRHKTKVEFFAVVLDDGVDILKKYNFDLSVLKLSNQKCNSFLKEIQDICGVVSVPSLHFHLARHWYCSALLKSGVPSSIARRCSGHSSERMLNRYQHIIAQDIVNVVSKHI